MLYVKHVKFIFKLKKRKRAKNFKIGVAASEVLEYLLKNCRNKIKKALIAAKNMQI